MAQFLRPDSNITQTSFTNGFAQIDEATASDADFAYGANNTAAVLEVGLSNPAATPDPAGTSTVRYRIARVNAGTLSGTGNNVTITAAVYQGTTLIQADSAQNTSGTWTQFSFTFTHGSITDWTNLRLRFTTSASGGTAANRRGGAISWAEVEAPDAAVLRNLVLAGGAGSFALTGQAALFSRSRSMAAGAGSFALSGQPAALLSTRRLLAQAGSAALSGQSAALDYARVLQAAAAAFALNGQPAAFVVFYTLSASAGQVEWTGENAKLKHQRRTRLEKGQVDGIGYPTSVSYRRRQTLIG